MSPKESVTNNKVVQLIKDGVEKLGVRGFASAVKISPAIVSRYKGGKVGEPSQSTLEKLARYFGVTVSYLRGENDVPENHGEYYDEKLFDAAYEEAKEVVNLLNKPLSQDQMHDVVKGIYMRALREKNHTFDRPFAIKFIKAA